MVSIFLLLLVWNINMSVIITSVNILTDPAIIPYTACCPLRVAYCSLPAYAYSLLPIWPYVQRPGRNGSSIRGAPAEAQKGTTHKTRASQLSTWSWSALAMHFSGQLTSFNRQYSWRNSNIEILSMPLIVLIIQLRAVVNNNRYWCLRCWGLVWYFKSLSSMFGFVKNFGLWFCMRQWGLCLVCLVCLVFVLNCWLMNTR